VLNQIRNINEYPIVKQLRLSGRVIRIHGWFINLDENQVYEWDEVTDEYKAIV